MKLISWFALVILAPLAASENSLRVIAPYWDEETATWVFDEPRLELVKEPFIAGVPEMIDELVREIPGARNGFRLIFSHAEFPGWQERIDWIRSGMDGNWYRWERREMEGWLCPALLKFYTQPPRAIFVRAEPLE